MLLVLDAARVADAAEEGAGVLSAAPMPLWRRALAVRENERARANSARMSAYGRRGGRPRVHPKAKVGDVFGPATVIALLDPDATRNERVRVRCVCGQESDAYVFNLRTRRVCRRNKVK